MNLAEMGKLLATVSLIDPRVSRRDDNEKALMAQAWLEVVGSEVTFQFAAQCAKEHYQKSEVTFMPVHVVSKWKAEQNRKHEIDNVRAIGSTPRSQGMPAEVRAKLVEMGFKQP